MKLLKLCISLIVLFTVLSFVSCDNKKTITESVSIYDLGRQVNWEPLGEKMYLISLSMRRIDSLSADMNLRFTRSNIAGL